MKRTAVVFSPRYLAHGTGFGHPESPRRLESIMVGLKRSSIIEDGKCPIIEPKPARLKDLQLVHHSEYVRSVKRLSRSGGGLLGEHTVACRESFEVARLAAGGAMEAVDKVMAGEFQNVFALLRPPGHHAGPDHALGFCLFNNVAVAAAHLLQEFRLDRVLILDIDAHHGNGTQEIFYDSSKVLYVSLHEDPTEFPGKGFLDEVGQGEGLGYTVNVPFPFGTGDPSYWKAMKTIVSPIARQYRPQFILVSAGFDGYWRDPVGELSLSAYVYPRVFQVIIDLAHEICRGRVAAVLEGGYRPGFLRKIVPTVIDRMAGVNARIRDTRPTLNLDAQRRAEKTIEDARRIQSGFWSL